MAKVQTPLPPSVVNRARKSAPSAQCVIEQITAVIDSLHWYVDNCIRRYSRVELIRELGFRVSRGLSSADQRSMRSASSRGLLIDGVGKASQLRVMAESKTARCILERVVIAPVAGAATPNSRQLDDIFSVGDALSALETLRDVAQLAKRSKSGSAGMPHLGTVAVTLSDEGFEYDYQPGDFDLMRWLRLAERPIGRSEIDFGLFDNTTRGAGWVSPELKGISEAMVRDLGFSVNDLRDILTALLRLCLSERREFIVFEYAAPWDSAIPVAAVDFVTFSDEHLTLGDLRPSGTRHQRRRVWTSPLMKSGGRHYVLRDIVFESIMRWIRYLTQGDWPVPRNYLRKDAPNLYRALEERSRISGPIFEDYVNSLLDKTGLPRATLKKGAKVGIVTLSREIDSVVVDFANRRIHVLEFKNMSSDQNAKSLQSELKKFLGEYANKLKQSVDEVNSDKLAVVKRVVDLHGSTPDNGGATEDADSWSVEATFVFNSHSPIECLTAPQFFTGINADRIADLFGFDDDKLK
ncbi:hypothetical protein [Brachybacterium tyrofermentans]|uniref:hypothetical protein n=1 Tax=Brachybacterium tyrofermentans TaxID=47848 RepID=UPI003FD3D74B